MSRRATFAIAALLLAGGLVALSMRATGPTGTAAIRLETGAAPGPKRAPRSSEAVLSIAPGVRRESATAAAASVSPVVRQLAQRREYKALYDRIKAAPAPSAEERYALAEILERCANVTDRKGRQPGYKLGGEEARGRFLAALAPGVPDREARIAAFDRINHDPCAGLEGLETTEVEIRSLLGQAAAQGDMKARALLLAGDIERSRTGANGEVDWSKPVAISDAQVEEFRRIVASGDPRALVDVVRIFGANLDLHLRSPDGSVIRPDNLYSAATLVACDLGYPCGPDSSYLLNACALEGYCGAADYRDFLFYYGTAPGDSQRIAEYQAQLTRAIRQNDWSFFDFHRGPSPSMAPFQRR